MFDHYVREHFEDGGVVEPPKNTVKAYKLFRTNPRKPGQLFPLFVDADTPVPIGKWIAAKAGDPGKDPTKVKSKLGDLAYRPGWHSGDLPVATHIGGKSSRDLKAPDYRPDNQVWAEVEHPDDVDWQSVANSRMEYTKDGRPKPATAHITDQVPAGGHYRYKTNPNMTGNWIISGGMKVNRVLSDDEVQSINDAAGVSDLPRLKKADGGDVEGYIPNGDPRRERNFQKWFGKSTAVDGKSNPWVHYHITTGNFSKFIPGGFNPKMSGPAIWLTPNKKEQPAGHNTIERSGQFKEGANVMPLYVKIEKPLFVDETDPQGKARLQEQFGSKSFAWPMTLHPEDIQKMKDAGYDGIYHMQDSDVAGRFNPETGEGLETIVFHPSQVKSAIGNQGAFDPSDPDITKADGGEVEKYVYHGTAHSLLPFIAKGGLDPEASQGTTWFHKDPQESRRYAEDHPNQMLGKKRQGALLRIPVSKLPTDALQHLPYSDITATEKSVPPEDIEHEQPDGSWKPLIDRKADGGALTDDEGITAYHGSPHDFEQFDTSKIGTGEGAQSYGHGLYFAGNEDVAKSYRDRLSGHHPGDVKIGDEEHPHWARREIANAFTKLGYDPETSVLAAHYINEHEGDLGKASGVIWNNENIPDSVAEALLKAEYAKSAGHMYEVHINAHPDHFLDWDRPIREHSEMVQNAIEQSLSYAKKNAKTPSQRFAWSSVFKRPDEFLDYTGSSIQNLLARNLGSQGASDALALHGIKGIKYLDAGSRDQTDEPTHNYVVFNHDHVKVRRKYERGGVVAKSDGGEIKKDMTPKEAADHVAFLLREGRHEEVDNKLMRLADPDALHKHYVSGNTGQSFAMDEKSRMERAKDMGYNVDKTYYHAGDENRSFSNGKGEIYATVDKDLAKSYQEDYDRKHLLPLLSRHKNTIEGGNLIETFNNEISSRDPSLARVEHGWQALNPEHLESLGGNPEDAKKLLTHLKGQGYDSAFFDEDYSPMGDAEPASSRAFFYPETLRHKDARFDPRLSHVSDLHAASGGSVDSHGENSRPIKRPDSSIVDRAVMLVSRKA